MRAPALSAALAGAPLAEWCLRVPQCYGADPRRWPTDVVTSISKSQDIWLGRLDSGDPERGNAKIEIIAETTACIFLDGAWWCVVVWHYVATDQIIAPSGLPAARDAAATTPPPGAGRTSAMVVPAGAFCSDCGAA